MVRAWWRGAAVALLVVLVAWGGHSVMAGGSHPVVVLYIQGVINPVTASYVRSGILQAEAEHASLVVLEEDTPGGLASSMDEIIEALLNSTVPTVVYVHPSGARADSAGLFVAQAADLVAMTPGSNIGSAHPVLLDLAGSATAPASDIEGRKILSDAVARIRDLAGLHHRNQDWVALAVTQSVNAGAAQAVGLHVADLEAVTLGALLRQLAGRQVTLADGHSVILHLGSATISRIPMNPIQNFLHEITNPDLAFIFLILAAVGILVEFTHPGMILPGLVGVVGTLLALYTLTELSANLTGVLLILFAFALLIADLKLNSHGVLTAGGVVCLALGGSLLFGAGIGSQVPYQSVSLWLVLPISAATATALLLVGRRVVAARRRPAWLRSGHGLEGLLGATGRCQEALEPDGMVRIEGGLFQAHSLDGWMAVNDEVEVTGVQGRVLLVAHNRHCQAR